MQQGSAGELFAAVKRRLVRAALTGVTLNSGNANVITGSDVTSQTTALSPDIGAYRWTVNGANLQALNVPFNTGATITDLSGNSLTGTINGGASYTTTGCQVGGCMTFDGVDDDINFGDVSAVEGVSALAFGGWIKPTEYAQSTSVFDLRGIFTKGSMNGDNTSTFTSFFQGDGATGYNFICSVDTTTDFPGLFANAVTNFPLNTWTHYLCTWSSGSPVRLYVNGVEVGSTPVVNGTIIDTAFPLRIGFSDNGTDDRFKGQMDEMQVYNRALTSSQVLQIYNNGLANIGGPTTINSAETSVGQLWDLFVTPVTTAGSVGSAQHSTNKALIVSGSPTITGTLDSPDEGSPIIANLTIPGGSVAAYRWLQNGTGIMTLNVPFNSGATQYDLSGNASDLTVNGATFTTSGCRVGNCMSFDGNDWVSRTLPVSMKTTSITLSSWVKLNSITGSAQNIIAGEPRAANAFGKGVHLYVGSTGVPAFNKGSGTGTWIGTGGTSALSTGTWYHLAGTVDGTAVKLYVNGALVGTNTNALAIDWTDGGGGNYPDPAQLYLGAFKDNALNSGATIPNISFLNGVLDDVQVYDRALSNAEIIQLYQDGAASLGGPTRISAQEHALGETWGLIATDLPSIGTVGVTSYIADTTIAAAASTTLNITTPVGSQVGNVTVNYSCSDTTSLLRDLLVEYSTNGGSSFSPATVTSASSGSVAGSLLSMVACNSGTSNNSFIWNSVANGVGNNSTVQLRITAQYTGGASATTSNFTVANGITNTFTTPTTIGAGNTTYDGTTIVCSGTTLTINGAHTFANMLLQSGCALTHSGPSTTIVTKMTLTITGDFTVQSGATVNVNGVGFYGGGFGCGSNSNLGYTSDGAGGGVAVFPQATGQGPAHGGRGYGWNGASNTNAYDSTINPTEPGAGGGEWNGCGGHGGGAVIITAATATINGSITANATTNAWIGGAGGTINIQASGAITGSGTMSANGTAGSVGISGGGGRIAVVGSTVSLPVANITNSPGDSNAGAGTIFIKETLDTNNPNGIVYVKGTSSIYGALITGSENPSGITVTGGAKATLIGASTVSNAIVLNNGGLEFNTTGSSVVTANSVTMQNSALMTHYPTSTSTVQRLKLNVATTFTQDATSTLTVTGRGFLGGHVNCGSNSNLGYTSDGAGGMVAVFPQATSQGPAHGGRGLGWNGASNTNAYDSVVNPTEPGAGGGEWNGCGGHGGGSVIITAGSFVLDGTSVASAVNNGGWIGGAGGTINFQATGAITGSGTITANGTAGGVGISGGGGRVALIGSTVTFPAANVFVSPGDANAGSGTLYIKETSDTARPNGKLYVQGATSYYATPVAGSFNFDVVTVRTGGKLSLVGASTISDAITLDNGGLEFNTTGSSIVTANSVSMQNSALMTHYPTSTTTVQRLKLNVATTFTQDATSTITVAGRGFLGGHVNCGSNSNLGYTSDGAGGMVAVFPQATSQGPAHAGRGYGWNGASNTNAYDSVVNPTEPGAGGGEWNGCGGHGGGSVIITAASFTLNGTTTANAVNNGGWIGGAGGTINLQATGSITGSGTISAGGTAGGVGISGGGGRVALIGSTVTIPIANITAAPGDTNAGSGTIFIKQTSDAVRPNGVLYVTGSSGIYGTPVPGSDNYSGITVSGNGKANLVGAATIGDAILLNGGGLQIETTGSTAVSVNSVTLQNSGVLTQGGPSTTSQYKITMNVTGAFSVDATSQVNLNNKGFAGTNSLGWTSNGSGGGVAAFPQAASQGAAHGGRGYNWNGSPSTNTYDSLVNPVEPGAGAGEYNGTGWNGGGAFILTAGSITVNGSIVASSASGGGGWQGGAGGTINLQTSGTFSGNGTLAVNGGDGAVGLGGGGGRIAVHYGTNTFTGTMTAYGGASAAAGTIFIKQQSASYGNLTVNNNNANIAAYTPLYVSGQPSTYTLDDLNVINYGRLLIDTPCLGTPALTVLGVTNLSGNGTITNNQSGTCTVTQSAISVVTTTLPTAIQNAAYSQTIDSAGGYGPHSFVCRSGGSTVACSTVLPAGLSMNSSGVVSGTPTVVGTTIFTVRATESSPGVGFADGTISITVGNAPTAPTNLFANASDAQACCSSPVTDATPVFSAIFQDPDTGNTAGKYRIQVASDAGFTTLLWDSGASGTSIAAAAIGARSANITYGGSALSLGGVTYYWRIKFWDSTDLEGAFSAGATFTTSTAPSAPTALFSNDANAQSGLTNPIGLLAAHPVFSAVYNDPDIGDTANKYRVQVDNNNDFSSPVWDSGASGTNMTSCNEGARCANITFGGTDLAQNAAIYYWRIKFWDEAGLEGSWSQDPTSTNTFTMGQGGTSIQVQQQQAQQPQATVPDAPQAGAVEVLGPDSVRYNWIDMSNNETGFRILNEQGGIIAELGPGITQAVETGLAANSVVSGRSVIAYNAVGASSPSAFSQTVTAAPVLRPVIDRRGGDSVTFTIEPAVASFPVQTALRFEVIVVDNLNQSRTLTSDWIQQGTYTFSGIGPNDAVQVRVTMRNQSGLQNEPGTYQDIGALSRRFAVNLGVFKKGTEVLPRPMGIGEVIAVRMALESIGTDVATSVTINMPLPKYILYRPGTMIIDGRAGSDSPENGSVGNQNGVSASWARVQPGERHTVSFELAFDAEALKALLAAANPLISLQASVSFAESDAVFMSPAIILEPDLVTLQQPVEEPVREEEPTEDTPVVIPTPEETKIIEQILQQEFPPATPSPSPQQPTEQPVTSPAPTLQTGQTTTSMDGGSFNMDVTGQEHRLGLSGSASVKDDSIAFTGTTTEPFTLITLIFNDSVTAIVVSDAEGHWQTFVSAERLGIEPGQDATVKIEAIAAKGDLRSERVSVGEVTVSRARSGDITAEFDTVVSESPAITVIKEVQKEVVRVIEKNEPAIQTTLVVSAPVVVASSVPLWGYLPYAPTMIYHLITYVVGYSGRKKRIAARFYGVAYDSITKQPLALAIIRIYKVEAALTGAASLGAAAAAIKKLVTTVVTDKQGRYDALLQPGTYQLEVAKPGYIFPSQIVTTELDADYQHVYRQTEGLKVEGNQLTIPDVPLDPVNAQRQWQLATGIKKVWMLVQKAGNYLATPVLVVGAASSAAVVATVPDKAINWIIAILYIGLLAMQLKLKPKAQKAWGVVYDIASNAVLPLTALQLIEPASSKVVASRLSDYEGRFTFLPEPGQYVIKASKPGYQQVAEVVEAPQTDRQPLHGDITIEKQGQIINGDVAMRQG